MTCKILEELEQRFIDVRAVRTWLPINRQMSEAVADQLAMKEYDALNALLDHKMEHRLQGEACE